MFVLLAVVDFTTAGETMKRYEFRILTSNGVNGRISRQSARIRSWSIDIFSQWESPVAQDLSSTVRPYKLAEPHRQPLSRHPTLKLMNRVCQLYMYIEGMAKYTHTFNAVCENPL